jgi:eukaryotic-like serine/threonine-protein kinase
MIWQPGKKLQGDRYEIKEVLGAGRFSATYRAEILQGEQQGEWIVIKAPNDESMQRSDFDRLQHVFVRETFKLVKCRHPHIVQAEEPFQEDGIWCIPMKYIAGTTLDKRDRRLLPEAEAVKYIRQIGAALQVVHDHDLLHRDVTPANIMLRTRNGESEAVLIDFGLAREFDHDLTQTRTEEITPGYTPLELYSRNAKRGAFTDIYSLGATLYNLLTGKIPPSAEDRKLLNARIDFQGISRPMKQAIEWALELEPSDRPQSVQEWLEALEQTPQTPSNSPVISPVNPPDSSTRQQKINWATFWAAAGVIVAALGLVIQQCASSNSPPPSSPSPAQTTTP